MNDTTTSRQRRKQETREALLASAYQLFCRNGYAATSVDRVARAAGFTTGALYVHFPNKEALFLALQRERWAGNTVRGLQAVMDSGTLDARARALGHFLFRAAQEQHAWALANTEFLAFAARRPELRELLAEVDGEVLRDMGALVESTLAPDVRLAPVALTKTARQIAALVDGVTLQAALVPRTPLDQVLVEGVTHLLVAATTSAPQKGRSARAAR